MSCSCVMHVRHVSCSSPPSLPWWFLYASYALTRCSPFTEQIYQEAKACRFIVLIGFINPNSTGRGQSWPCQLWRQISGNILYNVLFFIWPIPEMSSKSFWTSDMASKNDVLTFFHQNFCRVTTLPPSPLLTGFTPITDHPSAGEVLPGRGLQCGAAPVKFQSVSGPEPRRVRGEAGSQSGRVLMLPHCSGQIPKTAALYTYA
jgi:hypothetical protein